MPSGPSAVVEYASLLPLFHLCRDFLSSGLMAYMGDQGPPECVHIPVNLTGWLVAEGIEVTDDIKLARQLMCRRRWSQVIGEPRVITRAPEG